MEEGGGAAVFMHMAGDGDTYAIGCRLQLKAHHDGVSVPLGNVVVSPSTMGKNKRVFREKAVLRMTHPSGRAHALSRGILNSLSYKLQLYHQTRPDRSLLAVIANLSHISYTLILIEFIVMIVHR